MLHDHRNIRTIIVIHIDVLIFRRGRFRSAFLISVGGRLGVSCGRDRFSAGSEDGSQHQKSQSECYQFFHDIEPFFVIFNSYCANFTISLASIQKM